MKVYIGIDCGTRSSTLCVLNEEKEVLEEWRGSNRALCEKISSLPGEKYCVIEAGALSEFLCEEIEKTGSSIEVIDSRHTKALLHGKKKTDKIDAKTLAELCVLGWYKPIYRKGGKAREQRTIMNGRASLVNVSTQLKNTVRGLLKGFGVVLPAGGEGTVFVQKVRESISELPEDVQSTIEDILSVWHEAYKRQKQSYRQLARRASQDKTTKRLMTVPGVGPATALAFTSTLVTPTRFGDGKQVVGYLGLAPRVHQSGETCYHGRITKKGDKLTRWLLVEAAHIILTRVKEDFPLKKWGLELAQKKGFAKAKVAVARRLALLLFALWQSGKDFSIPQPA